MEEKEIQKEKNGGLLKVNGIPKLIYSTYKINITHSDVNRYGGYFLTITLGCYYLLQGNLQMKPIRNFRN